MQQAKHDSMGKDAFMRFLASKDGGGCVEIKTISGGDIWIGYSRLIFHWTLKTGIVGDYFGYEDRWCYETEDGVRNAFHAWDGTGEPTGWRRHPKTGRRRTGGDPATEHINF